MNFVGKKNKECRISWLTKVLNGLPKGSKILDAGAGERQYQSLCTHLDYISQDFGKYDGNGDQSGLQKDKVWNQTGLDIISDITEIPEENESFDHIMCIEVFEHIPEPVKALKELDRLLKPNGNLILTVPFCSLSHFTPFYYYTGFSSYFFKHFLEENYDILEIEYNGNFFEWLAQEVRRIPNVVDKYGKGKVPFYYKIVEFFMLKILNQLSRKDEKSHELLSFGLHVHGRKKIK